MLLCKRLLKKCRLYTMYDCNVIKGVYYSKELVYPLSVYMRNRNIHDNMIEISMQICYLNIHGFSEYRTFANHQILLGKSYHGF